MQQILACVEGQTEELFIKEVLSPFLNNFNIHLVPTIINTKIVKGGNNFKGGLNTYKNLKKDIVNSLKNKSIIVTTFVDYYGLPHDFPGYNETGKFSDSYSKVIFLEQKLKDDIGNERFLPYIQIHEFESLLFSSIYGFGDYFDSEIYLKEFQAIINQFPNPEDINDNLSTAPSKRILKIIPEYEKILYGSLICLSIGIENILQKCPHFSDWVNNLKSFRF